MTVRNQLKAEGCTKNQLISQAAAQWIATSLTSFISMQIAEMGSGQLSEIGVSGFCGCGKSLILSAKTR